MRSEISKMERKRGGGSKKKLKERGGHEKRFEREMVGGKGKNEGELGGFHSKAMMEGEVTGETREGYGSCWDMRKGLQVGGWWESNYWDEEELFNMPALINSMAEGLLIAPPALQTGFNWLPPETPFHFTLWAD